MCHEKRIYDIVFYQPHQKSKVSERIAKLVYATLAIDTGKLIMDSLRMTGCVCYVIYTRLHFKSPPHDV